jgi:hypothetical protein
MPNIYQRINLIRADVSFVSKDSLVRTGGEGSYSAVSHDAVTAAIRSAMIEHGVVCVPTLIESKISDAGATKRGTPIIRFEGRYDVIFVNCDDPSDRLILSVEAHANDQGDKAPGKAISYATKVAFLKVFTLETGDDDESRVDPSASTTINDRLLRHNGAMRECIQTIIVVKDHLAEKNIDAAAEAFAELTRPEQIALWVAPSKGGIFTTEEFATIKSTDFTTVLHARRTDAGWYDNPENAQ